ncbi:glycosyl hydrolases family 31-domain-containing protein [Kockovaella imperatae]|uniref:Glycosyl hydrolases family 31-domain-containing protein n=1 Tax=Kockovaella imperatae TaxID=4999 RepID=A0A1Y1UHY4_9TREE|nr:glycosyl hydrolases family 31-domain-containing protein [Kockovaella imperatae]ORX37673.1 glycosyl hydrolases family 31-domain-containing protein [Kockovaella imperatae]
MPIVERDLHGWSLAGSAKPGESLTSFSLKSSSSATFQGFTFTLSFPLANAYRVFVTGPDRPAPPHDNVIYKGEQDAGCPFTIRSIDEQKCQAVLAFPNQSPTHLDGAGRERELHLEWSESLLLNVWETNRNGKVRLIGDLPGRSYAMTEHGMIRHWWIERNNLHVGLGERAAPLDLTSRSFTMTGTDGACYDAYEGDPLYKHTPFLISTPRPEPGDGPESLPSTYAIYHPTNSVATWDIGRWHDDPWGYHKTFVQDWGGLEEWVLVGKGVKEVVRTFGELVGMPKLVPRDWLGYLASGMGLGESDKPIAQELLSTWPDLCKKHDIPCSAMHLSSGYTVGEDGNRYTFHMNTRRYPDFKGMIKLFHKAGIKIVPNIKPYMLDSHEAYDKLHAANALFHDPWTKNPVKTRIWSSAVGVTGKGGWVDMTSPEGRQWWADGVQSLIDLGCDGMWNDNDEYHLHDDAFICRNDMPVNMRNAVKGETNIGLMGRMLNTEMMGKISHDTLIKNNPDRRPFIVTRSGNVGTFKYVASTWSGDNETSWKNLRGSQAIQLNAGLSLMQSYGSDIGGFGGPLPTPEMFTRWVQLGVTHSRFCIHSFKPNKVDPSGAGATNTPWMYPEVLPIIREAIKWRYEFLPYFNSLMWSSHLEAEPTNAPLMYGDFASDANLFSEESLNGFDAWIGAGRLLSAPALFEGLLSREVYFPKSSPKDTSLYFDLHAPYGSHAAGSRAIVSTPLEHMGLFAREGSVIPIGKSVNTVTQTQGPARTTHDGVDVVLESEGGVVALDDWRGVLIFPGEAGQYSGEWIEDDGISTKPSVSTIHVSYSATKDKVTVKAQWKEHGFKPLWGDKIHIMLPYRDERKVEGAEQVMRGERKLWFVSVS